MSHADFVHLHVHTAYSLCEGAVKTGELAKTCREAGMPAVAMTDSHNLSGAAVFTKDLSGAGVQPIIGLQIMLADAEIAGEIVLLAQDKGGFANLVDLVSQAYLRTENGLDPKIGLADLETRATGVILLTGGPRGPVNRLVAEGRTADAEALLARFKQIFADRAYVELVRHGLPGEREVETALISLADAAGMPLVATNDVFFTTPDMHEAHDVLLCIGQGAYLATAERRRVSPEAWLKPAADMRALFCDLPDACDNTVEIARRCAVAFEKAKPMLPPFPGLKGRTEEEEMRAQAIAGLETRLRNKELTEDQRKAYFDRLEYELGVIAKMGFAGYFLIVADFIGWAKDNGIPVGPGRGSGAGSIAAWALRITDLDPLEYQLLFERFLNPDRVSMPDFDIDFCQERREEVIEYVKRRYGAERVAQIGTIGKLKARAAVRDVGRVLQVPFGLVNRFASMIPDNPNDPKTLAEALQLEPLASEFARAEYQVRRMFEIAMKLEGLHRNMSTHAAGVVIAERPIHEVVPVFRDKDGMVATQYDMKAVEDAGLVKFDFLGLKTLDVIQGAIDMLAKDGVTIDFDKIGVADKATYEMLAAGESFGVFQLESMGMRKAIRLVKPSDIHDVIALCALYRPGPMENIPTYAAVKHGEQPAQYLHPLMEPVLKDTYSIIVYQEQVMELGRVLAGYSLGQADLLRRAMGKKIKAEMDAQQAVFIEGAKAGWVEATTDDGRTVRMHRKTKVKAVDGRMLTLEEAMAEGVEVDL